ncbi:MAG TPA: serine/threonine-protein kinase, partial [Polyangiaceae bacterium]|nr:serine/threonine-protein kinase [Polyangiaceae bacterium]
MNATARDELGSGRRAYRRLFELGRGGMARVFLAESLTSGLRKLVVLKILNPEFCANQEMRDSFQREAELSAQMNHPNVVQVMEVVEHAQAPVIVMEYLDGKTLSQLLRKTRELPLHLHLHVLAQVLAGLHHFHDLKDLDGTPLNAVHRDVSPQNVVVLHDGPVKVLDFGIAKVNAADEQVTRAGIIKGKIHYMPPEQLCGDNGIDRRADVFAVGVMMWEAIAQRRMWEGKTEADVLRHLATGFVPQLRDFAPMTPPSLLEIVKRATQVERDARFADAREMQVAIEQALAAQNRLVQPRELADFMAQHFGDARREQEAEIKAALRAPAGADLMMNCGTPQRLSFHSLRAEAATLTADGSERSVSRVWRTNRRNWGFALGA